MLKNTFHHVPGIGAKTEMQIWGAGVKSWDDFEKPYPPGLPGKKIVLLENYIRESQKHFADHNIGFFADLLPSGLHWRFFPEFRNEAVYLDIETTGLDESGSEITTIAMYDGKKIYHYVQGINLDDFADDICRYRLIITYNGKTFDVPFIERYFKISLAHAHIDLRYLLGSLGYKGGLKRCEKALGIGRPESDGLDGSFAVLLWFDYLKNDNAKALETLLAYNIEDVLNLEPLMTAAYNMKISEMRFFDTLLPDPVFQPDNPFHADRDTVDRLTRVFHSQRCQW